VLDRKNGVITLVQEVKKQAYRLAYVILQILLSFWTSDVMTKTYFPASYTILAPIQG
jgi:hypothetical protein